MMADMTRSLTTLLTRRYVASGRKGGFISLIAWFSMLGIMLGVATLILVTSLMNGIRQEMLANFIGIDGHIRIQPRGEVIANVEPVLERLREALPPGATILPRIEGQVMVTGKGDAAAGAQVIALRPDDLAAKPKLAGAVDADGQAQFADTDGVLVGARLAERLRLKEGEAITLISPQGRATAFGSVPRIKPYPMADSIELGMHAIDSSLVVMHYDKALVYFALTRKGAHPASMIEVTLPQSGNAAEQAARLQAMLGRDFRVFPWQRLHRSVFSALEVQRNVMVMILALIILVATFNIISSLVMLVKDKRRDIAILRTMGMSRRAIIGLFILTGMSIGIAGSTLGMGLGLLAAANLDALRLFVESLIGQPIMVEDLYFLSTLPTQTDPAEVAVIMAVALGLAFAATIYPAWRAASTDPAEVLSHD